MYVYILNLAIAVLVLAFLVLILMHGSQLPLVLVTVLNIPLLYVLSWRFLQRAESIRGLYLLRFNFRSVCGTIWLTRLLKPLKF